METNRKPQKGDRVGEYVLEERLGGGGFGEVWKASHPLLPGEIVAVKIPTDPAFIENLKREGVMQANLAGKHIVDVKGLDPAADPPYLTMEYVAGKSLRELLVERRRLPLDAAVDILLQCLEGLATAHSHGVVHHDIKPENILLTEDGVVKLADFGLGRAQETTASMMLQSGSMVTGGGASVTGTLRYMAPEQREGQRGDARSDLYALGVVLFEMVTGEFPQGAELPSEVNRDLPSWVDRVFGRCYTRLERRYASADEMRREVEAQKGRNVVFLGEVTVRPERTAPTKRRGAPAAAPRPMVPAVPRPQSPLLWPFYLLFLVFHGLAVGTQELLRFLSGDHPERSRVAPYFILFLGLFGISLMVSLVFRGNGPRAARHLPNRPATAPILEDANEVPVTELIDMLRSEDFRAPARRALVRRGPTVLSDLTDAYLTSRSQDPDHAQHIASVIEEIRQLRQEERR